LPLPLSRPFLEGARAVLPVLPGVATFGMISGVAMVGSGMTPLTAMAMSIATYAGTAQLAALQLLGAGAPIAVILLAALVLNLRFALYSLSMAPHLRAATTRRKWLYSYLLSDNGYGLFITRYTARAATAAGSGPVGTGSASARSQAMSSESARDARLRGRIPACGAPAPRSGVHPDEGGKAGYFLGACTMIWTTWQASTAVGIAVGAGIPAHWRLEFTVTLTFFALGISLIRDRALAVAAATAAAVAILAMGLPYRLGLLAAAAAGIAAGMATERWTR
jgi:predicted branched-subunit amino acid permease